MSRGFVRALIGIAMTLLAWYGPWAWPGWPALVVVDVVFGGQAAFAELPQVTRAAVVVLLIVVNVGAWALLAWMLSIGAARVPRRAHLR